MAEDDVYVCALVCANARTHARVSVHMFVCVCVCVLTHLLEDAKERILG